MGSGGDIFPPDGSRPGRSGRRPGAPPTRDRILLEARHLFADRGFERTTIRAIATAARVDPALVLHYYGSKDDLFAAALTLPSDLPPPLPTMSANDPAGAGERAVRTFLGVWDDRTLRPGLMALIRCAASNEHAATVMREVITRQILRPVTDAVSLPHADMRATLVASQFVGLAMVRYILRVEPLASATTDQVVQMIAPNIQRYITGDLGTYSSAADADERAVSAAEGATEVVEPSPPS